MNVISSADPNMANSASCAGCGAGSADFVCGDCSRARYCGAECQRDDWPSHAELICNEANAREWIKDLQANNMEHITTRKGMDRFVNGVNNGSILITNGHDNSSDGWAVPIMIDRVDGLEARLRGSNEVNHNYDILDQDREEIGWHRMYYMYANTLPVILHVRHALNNVRSVTLYNRARAASRIGKLLSRRLRRLGHTPHILTYIDSWNTATHNYTLSVAPLYGSLYWYMEHYRFRVDEFIRGVLFSVAWTLTAIQRKWPHFRHGGISLIGADLGPADGYTKYTDGSRSWELPNTGMRPVLWDFSNASIPTILDNEVASLLHIQADLPQGADLFILATLLFTRFSHSMGSGMKAMMEKTWPGINRADDEPGFVQRYTNIDDAVADSMPSPEDVLNVFFDGLQMDTSSQHTPTDTYTMPRGLTRDDRAEVEYILPGPWDAIDMASLATLPLCFGGIVPSADLTMQMIIARRAVEETGVDLDVKPWTGYNKSFGVAAVTQLYPKMQLSALHPALERFGVYAEYLSNTFQSKEMAISLLRLICEAVLGVPSLYSGSGDDVYGYREKLVQLGWLRVLNAARLERYENPRLCKPAASWCVIASAE